MAGRQLQQDIHNSQAFGNSIAVETDSNSASVPSTEENLNSMPLWSSPLYLTYTDVQECLDAFHKECHFNNLSESDFLLFVTLKAREKRKKELEDRYCTFFETTYDNETKKARGFAWLGRLLHQYIFPSINDVQYRSELASEAINVIELCPITRYEYDAFDMHV
jgi:hypothetical protein